MGLFFNSLITGLVVVFHSHVDVRLDGAFMR